ncbi:hypothetical protein EYF80_040937 [Liparis tanakae]|uniref:Uncharacterized protein n=1 Tax=Liparis tanakae TaxID=230148 RepID=A0A4Z2G6I5_9TELE|nr:hypothetical protein EYF80_040937 [Liparis tanakae]
MRSTQSGSSRGQQRVNFPQQPPQKFRATVVDAPLAQMFFCQGPALTSQSHRLDPALPQVGHLCHELRSVKEKSGRAPYLYVSHLHRVNRGLCFLLRRGSAQLLPLTPQCLQVKGASIRQATDRFRSSLMWSSSAFDVPR